MSQLNYTVSQFADMSGVSVWTVRRWIQAGHVKAIKGKGMHMRIPASEVRRMSGGETA